MSASIIYLSSNDFYISTPEGNEQPKLCNKLKGLSLVYFSSNQCDHCDTFQPLFESMPQVIGGCYFATINVSNFNQVVKASEKTTTPIKYVPYLILYLNHIPFMKYDGVREVNAIKTFIIEVSSRLHSNQEKGSSTIQGASMGSNGSMDQTLKQMNVKTDGDEKALPAYTTGKPKNVSNVCFLTLDEAYGKKH